MINMGKYETLASYLLSNPTLFRCKSGGYSHVIIVILITLKPFQSGWFRILKNFEVKLAWVRTIRGWMASWEVLIKKIPYWSLPWWIKSTDFYPKVKHARIKTILEWVTSWKVLNKKIPYRSPPWRITSDYSQSKHSKSQSGLAGAYWGFDLFNIN